MQEGAWVVYEDVDATTGAYAVHVGVVTACSVSTNASNDARVLHVRPCRCDVVQPTSDAYTSRHEAAVQRTRAALRSAQAQLHALHERATPQRDDDEARAACLARLARLRTHDAALRRGGALHVYRRDDDEASRAVCAACVLCYIDHNDDDEPVLTHEELTQLSSRVTTASAQTCKATPVIDDDEDVQAWRLYSEALAQRARLVCDAQAAQCVAYVQHWRNAAAVSLQPRTADADDATSGALVDTVHTLRVVLPATATALAALLRRQPHELRRCVCADVACACALPVQHVRVDDVTCNDDEEQQYGVLVARVCLTHHARTPRASIDAALSRAPYASLRCLVARACTDGDDDDVCGVDALLPRLCDALGVTRQVVAGMTVDEAIEPLTRVVAERVTQASAAYESEIADLLLLQCHARDDVAALRSAHDRAMGELRQQLASATHREQALTRECAQLLDVTARLKELTVRQDSELQRLRAAQRSAAASSGNTPRLHRAASNAALLSARDVASVTMEEYDAQAARCDALAQQLADALRRGDALAQQLAASERDAAHYREHARDVESALAVREDEARATLERMHEELATQLSHARHANARADALHDEVVAFRRRRLDSYAARRSDATLATCAPATADDEEGAADEYVAVPPATLAREPLFVVCLDEYATACARATQLAQTLDDLYDKLTRMQVTASGSDGDAPLSLAARMLQLIDDVAAARAAAQGAHGAVTAKDAQLAQLRHLLAAEEARAHSDLASARDDAARLQRELDVVTRKLDEVCALYSDAMSSAGDEALLARVEGIAAALGAARAAQQAAVQQLHARDAELTALRAELAQAVTAAALRERDAHDATALQLAELRQAHAHCDARLAALQQSKAQLTHALAERGRELQRMAEEWDALQATTQELMRELQAHTSKYDHVVDDVTTYAEEQVSGRSEKALLHTLAAREQELYELQEARRGELAEHAQQVALLHDQLQRLRERSNNDTALCDALQGEVARLRSALAAAEATLREREDEVEELKAGIETIVDEHDAQVRDTDAVLDAKSREASDALARLEEMSAMLQEARESEASALRLRTLSDSEVFRLQKELDRLQQQQQQPPPSHSVSDSSGSGGGVSSSSVVVYSASNGSGNTSNNSMAPYSDVLHSIHEQQHHGDGGGGGGSSSATHGDAMLPSTSHDTAYMQQQQQLLRDRVRALEEQLQTQKAADDELIRELCTLLQRTMTTLEHDGTTMASSSSRLTSTRQRVEAVVQAM